MHRRIQICSIFIIAPLTLIHPTAIGEIQKLKIMPLSVWYNLSEMLKLSIFRWNHSTQVAGIISATIFPSSFIITVFFCLISSCLTLLCCLRFPSTSSLTLLWPFTLSSSFTLFAWNSLLLRPLFSFSCPSYHLFLFSTSSCFTLLHLPTLLFSFSARSAVLLVFD